MKRNFRWVKMSRTDSGFRELARCGSRKVLKGLLCKQPPNAQGEMKGVRLAQGGMKGVRPAQGELKGVCCV